MERSKLKIFYHGISKSMIYNSTEIINGLKVEDIKKFLNLFKLPIKSIPLNEFIKVSNIKFYINNKLNINLNNIGWNCYHKISSSNKYSILLNSIDNKNRYYFNPLPYGFNIDKITGKIWSNYTIINK